MKTPSQPSTTTKPLLSRLVHNYVHSHAAVSIRLRGLTIRFRPMSYDAVALYSIMFKQIYGVVPEGYSVVDIGAHIGIFSLFATRMLKVVAEGSEYEIIAAINAENFHKIERIALEYHVGNAVLRSAFPLLVHLLQSRAFAVSLRENTHIIVGVKKQIGIGAISE